MNFRFLLIPACLLLASCMVGPNFQLPEFLMLRQTRGKVFVAASPVDRLVEATDALPVCVRP